MRPIKFRAWDKKIGKWCDGNDARGFNLFGETLLIGGILRDGYYSHNVFERLFADVEIMQFTGLHDKNGKMIWEGDILKGTPFNYRVMYHAGGFCALKILPVLNEVKEDESKILWYMPYSIDNLGCEKKVLGNIYENPYLLKGTNQ